MIESRRIGGMDLAKDFLVPVLTFIAGLFSGLSAHIQKPLTEYRQTLTDISQLMIKSVLVMFSDSHLNEKGEKIDKANDESMKLYNDIRTLHARLVSSANAIPRFARPALRLLGLLRPRAQIKKGAEVLIGISNQVVTANKNMQHLTRLLTELKTALDIEV
jgi:hypothetical protein